MRASLATRPKQVRSVATLSPETSAVLDAIKRVFGLKRKWEAIDLLILYVQGRLSRREARILRSLLRGDLPP